MWNPFELLKFGRQVNMEEFKKGKYTAKSAYYADQLVKSAAKGVASGGDSITKGWKH